MHSVLLHTHFVDPYLTRKFLPFVDHVDVILQVSFVAKHLITD